MRIHHQSVASAQQVLGAARRQLRVDTPLRLAPRAAGWLLVEHGPVWLTRSGDAADHVLGDGERMRLRHGEQVVAEAWCSGQTAQLCWVAGPWAPPLAPGVAGVTAATVSAAQPVPRRPLPAAWAGLRRWLAGRLAPGVAARKAAPSASRAQGSICAGDSIASSGA